MSLAQPVHTATIAGKEVRFFRAPSGRPELPWHAADDLFAVCNFPSDLRERFRRMLQATWGGDIATIATPTGPVVIAPHFAAQGLLEAAQEIGPRLPMAGRLPAGLVEAYTRGAVAAMKAMASDLPPIARFEMAMQAARKSGIGGDGSVP